MPASTLGGTALVSAIGSAVAYRGARVDKRLSEEHLSKLRLGIGLCAGIS